MPSFKKIDTNKSSDSWDYRTEKVLEGVFTGNTRTVETKYGEKTLYEIEKSNHETVDVWETAQLKRGFSQLQPGMLVRITFNKKKLPEKGNAYNDFTIEVSE